MAEQFTCDACGAKFTSKQELDAHSKREHMQPSQPMPSGQQKKEM